MRNFITLFPLQVKILLLFFLIGIFSSNFSLASQIEEQDTQKKRHILERDSSQREILEIAQELWVREIYSPTIKKVILRKQDIIIKEKNCQPWISINGKLECFPVKVEIFFLREIHKRNVQKFKATLTFLDHAGRFAGSVKMLKKTIDQQTSDKNIIKTIYVLPVKKNNEK